MGRKEGQEIWGGHRKDGMPYIAKETGVTNKRGRTCARENDRPFRVENRAKWIMISLEPAVVRLSAEVGKYNRERHAVETFHTIKPSPRLPGCS